MNNNLTQYIKTKLQNKVGPDVLSNLDTHIFSAVMELQHRDLLPPRLTEFKSIERKKEWRTEDGTLRYHYYDMPEDFSSLDEFHVYGSEPFFEAESELEIVQEKEKGRWFTVVDKNFDEDSNWQTIMIVKPFPANERIVRLKYYTNGSDSNFDWITSKYWNAVLYQVQADLGVTRQDTADERVGSVVYENKNKTSKKQTRKKVNPSFFGNNRRWNR
jgi:hypothetical protein